jgi:hypothetical protein
MMCVQALHNAWLVRAHTAPHAGRQPCRCYTHGARTQRASVHNVRGRSTLRAKRPHAADAHMCAHAHAPREAGEHAVHVAAAPAPDVVQAHAAERLAVGWWWWSRVVEVAAAAAVHVRRGRWPVPSAHHPCPHPTPPPATHTPHTNTHHTPHNPPPPLLLNTTRPCPPPRVASAPPPPAHTHTAPVLIQGLPRVALHDRPPAGAALLRQHSGALGALALEVLIHGAVHGKGVGVHDCCAEVENLRARARACAVVVCVCVCVCACALWVVGVDAAAPQRTPATPAASDTAAGCAPQLRMHSACHSPPPPNRHSAHPCSTHVHGTHDVPASAP